VIAGVLIEALTLHVGGKKVSEIGEVKKKNIMAVMSAAMKGTKHENKINIDYVYNRLRSIEAERLQNYERKIS